MAGKLGGKFALQKKKAESLDDEAAYQIAAAEDGVAPVANEQTAASDDGIVSLIMPDSTDTEPKLSADEQAFRDATDPAVLEQILTTGISGDPAVAAEAAKSEASKPTEKTAEEATPEETVSETDEAKPEEEKTPEEEEEENRQAKALYGYFMRSGATKEEATEQLKQLRAQNKIGEAYQTLSQQKNAQMDQSNEGRKPGRGGGSGAGGGGRSLMAGTVASLQRRVERHRRNKYAEDLVSFNAAVDTFGKDIEAANLAFTKTHGGKALKQLADIEKMDYATFVGKVTSGEIQNPLAETALDNAMADPDFKKAMTNVWDSEGKVKKFANESANGLRKLVNNYPDTVDGEKETQALQAISDKAVNLPAPLTEDPKTFKESMEKIMENVRKIMERITQSIGQMFKM